MLTKQDILMFTYNPATGKIYKNGRLCTARINGYTIVYTSDRRQRQAHRVAWELLHGPIPNGYEIDHINGNRADNRLSNLRCVTRRENTRNSCRRIDNTSGAVGVYKRKNGIYTVEINSVYIGSRKSFEDAVALRKEAELKFNYHPNHGRVVQSA